MKIESLWSTRSWITYLLWPLSVVYRCIASLRRALYQKGVLKQYQAPVPVIIVGNILAGGAGKTPLTMALVELLKEQGWSPGVVSRGYRSDKKNKPLMVGVDTPPNASGDEPLLIARKTCIPVAVFPVRATAIQHLLAQNENVNIIVCDDGLQHYALARDIEIAVVSSVTGHGNGFCLPAGPLREPRSRLNSVDFVVANGSTDDQYAYTTHVDSLERLSDAHRVPLAEFRGQSVHALCGIAHSGAYFNNLKSAGIKIDEHEFEDHHAYVKSDLEFGDDLPIIMTEKDGIKIRLLDVRLENCWQTNLQVSLSQAFRDDFLDKVSGLIK